MVPRSEEILHQLSGVRPHVCPLGLVLDAHVSDVPFLLWEKGIWNNRPQSMTSIGVRFYNLLFIMMESFTIQTACHVGIPVMTGAPCLYRCTSK